MNHNELIITGKKGGFSELTKNKNCNLFNFILPVCNLGHCVLGYENVLTYTIFFPLKNI